MAPIVFAVRSAILQDAPSRGKRALPAANAPSTVIGITVLVTCCAVAIGATCWLFWWKRRRGSKTQSSVSELGGTIVHELKSESIASQPASELIPEPQPEVHELAAASSLADEKAALSPEYSDPQHCQHPALNRTPTSQPTIPTGLDTSKTEKRNAIERILGINTRFGLERSSFYGGKSGPSYSPASADKIFAARPSLYIAPANVWDSNSSGILQNQPPQQAYVDPHEVEFRPNPVIFPTSHPSPSNKLDATSPIEVTSSIEALSPDTEVQRLGDYVTFDFDLPPGTEMSDHNEFDMRQPTPDGNRTFIDTAQGEAILPLSHDLAQAHPDDEMEMQIDHPKSPSIQRETIFDVVSSDSSNPRAEDTVPVFVPASTPDLAPRKRVAGRDLSRLETSNSEAESLDNRDRTNIDRSRQRRRHHQRALLPKTSSPRSANVTASPQSSKSTPDSARTDLSFASTATHVPSPGSSVITTPSIDADSPATPFTPSDNKLICRDCGQVFSTPGQQK